jgi:glycosidase
MLQIRKEYADLMVLGDFKLHDVNELDTFTFVKEKGGKKMLAVLNFSDEEQPMDVPHELKRRLPLPIPSIRIKHPRLYDIDEDAGDVVEVPR